MSNLTHNIVFSFSFSTFPVIPHNWFYFYYSNCNTEEKEELKDNEQNLKNYNSKNGQMKHSSWAAEVKKKNNKKKQ